MTPTPDDGTRLTGILPWDEASRPTCPRRADPGEQAAYGPAQLAVPQHLVDVHDHLCAELTQVRDVVDQVVRGHLQVGAARSAVNAMTMRQNNWTLGAYCESYCRVVTGHHSLEDSGIFPHLRARDPDARPVIDRLEEEHEVIHDVLDDVDRALVALVTDERGASTGCGTSSTCSPTPCCRTWPTRSTSCCTRWRSTASPADPVRRAAPRARPVGTGPSPRHPLSSPPACGCVSGTVPAARRGNHNEVGSMGSTYDYVIVGAGSAGAVVAARLTEDPDVRVCLLEAGGTPPPAELMPAAVASLQNDPSTDWMFTGDPGGVGKGLVGGRMMVPRGKMLGGSSGINYMAYVRGHPGDFDAWAAGGAQGWSYDEVLPYFLKAEGFVHSTELHPDLDAHGSDGPVGVSVREPVLPASTQFVDAAGATGLKQGDYNGRDRREPQGVASLFQTTTKDGKRSSTFHAYLEPAMHRENLTVVTGALVERILLDGEADAVRATGVRYRTEEGVTQEVSADTEVVLCAGAIGSPHLLMLSGVGAREALAEAGVDCLVDLPDVGQHLKDHLHTPIMFAADGIGETMVEIAMSLGPDALRAPAGPLPADPADDVDLPEPLAAAKAEAERRLGEWFTTGRGLASSSLYDAVAFYSTGLGDEHTHDAQIGFLACGYTPAIWEHVFRIRASAFFEDPDGFLDPTKGQVVLLPNPVQPHSEGSVTLASADPAVAPRIDLNYLADPHDVVVMVSVIRRALEIAAAWPGGGLGDPVIPPHLAQAHGHDTGSDPSDELLEDMARHYALTVYHETSTCRMGDVVDAQLRVLGVAALRVADSSVMPNIVSGNINAAAIMIGEKAAEMIAGDHGVRLHQVVGPR